MDQQKQTVIRHRGQAYPSFGEQFLPPLQYANEYRSNLSHNIGLFLRRRFHQKQGMKYLTERFYAAIRREGPVPIPYREILLTTRIMDMIFLQIEEGP